jgi:integrase
MAAKKNPRPHGTGSIVQCKDGRWRGRHKINGKSKYIYAKTKAECNRKLLAAIKSAKQKKEKPERVLIKNYMPAWLANRVDYRANSTQNRTVSIGNHIVPAFGDREIGSITRSEVQAFVAGLVALGLAPSTVRSIYETLSAALGSAVDDELIEISPCMRVKLPPKTKAEHTILDLAQAHRLCDQMRGHWLLLIVKLALATGMRKCELLALKWSDIDFSRGVIAVRHNFAYLPRLKFVPGPPKTKTSERTISLTQFIAEELKAHLEAQMKTRDVWAKNDLVFPNAKGDYRTPGTLNRCLDEMVVGAEVPRITFHELRHSAVSILLVLGINIKIIQELLGHSSIVITLELYAHLLPSAQGEAMQHYHDAWERARREFLGQKDVKTGAEGTEQAG